MGKVAIFHDYFDEIGGAEATVLNMAKALNAKIYTTNIDRDKINRLGFSKIQIESVGCVPNKRIVKQVCTALKFYFSKNKKYDKYVFVGSYSIFAAKPNRENYWFCISPLRGLYDLRFQKKSLFSNWLFKEIQIYYDQKAVSKIKTIFVNSVNTMKRVKQFYNRDSEVIYSPVDVSKFYNKKSKNYSLSVNRIDPYKRIEIQIEAFRKLPEENLIIVGGASAEFEDYFLKLKKNAPQNVKFLGSIFNENEIVKLYSECKTFIATAENEDFGKTVIEAMAAGKIVIAGEEGGYRETVIDGQTGFLIKDINSDKLAKKISEISELLRNKEKEFKRNSIEQSKKFDKKYFYKKIREKIIPERCVGTFH
ncbi:MAG: glycosyltransferase [Proteobacteria bacterium]|nr:glycosyltransferase [Pseudomonadota bacterium]MBU1388823.1 glycosyltransferase [Pseudomonadota bacterium]MBU1543164.1 glycosyltransferase [Pseudomonadota bacterium]